jgi:hypothetical protein
VLRGYARLERAWSRSAEWAADDRSVAGDAKRSVLLADTLVRVVRISAIRPLSPVVSSLMADSDDLAVRVDRLLCPARRNEDSARSGSAVAILAAVAIATAFASVVVYPAALRAVYILLESLVN